MPTVGRQTPRLCARKVSHNEGRRLSHTLGNGELNLGIANHPHGAAAATVTGMSSRRRHDGPALITDRCFVRALYDADVNSVASPIVSGGDLSRMLGSRRPVPASMQPTSPVIEVGHSH